MASNAVAASILAVTRLVLMVLFLLSAWEQDYVRGNEQCLNDDVVTV